MRVLPLEGHRSVVDGDNIVAVRGLYKIVHFASNMLTVLQLTYPLGPLNMATQFALLISESARLLWPLLTPVKPDTVVGGGPCVTSTSW